MEYPGGAGRSRLQAVAVNGMELKMILKRAFLCTLAFLLLSGASFAQEAVKDQVSCFTTWDDSYFYLAFKIDSPDVQATNSQPNSELAGDDAVEFYIETDNKHSAKITPACFSMSVSAAGGSNFRVGSESGALALTPVFAYKYGANIQGTNNNADDIDMGYNIEMAVPWQLFRRKGGPALGDMVSFNVIIRRHGDKSGSFFSLSPRVKTEEDILVPSKWSNLVFAAHTFGVATTSFDKILSAKYVVRSPLIDGLVGDKEWHQNTSFTIDLPMPPGFVYEAKFPVQRAVLARYVYWYQGDPRKKAPATPFTRADGSSILADVPAKGLGPWFSYDRVQWHKEELASMVGTGISIVLPDYLNAAGGADKGLDCLAAALTELRNEGKSYPMVGMYLDAGMLDAGSQTPGRIYARIKSFFDRIPRQFRAFAPAAKPYAGAPAAVVFLAGAKSLPSFSPAVLASCTQSFVRDFGCPLVWIADEGLADASAGLDGVAGVRDSRITVAAVRANDSCSSDWADAIAKNPMWVYCDAWNDFASGKCICQTRGLGSSRMDLVKGEIKRFLVARDYSAQYIRYDLPKVVSPKDLVQAEVTVRNAGNTIWRSLDGFALGYRWYRNGRYYGESKVRMPISSDVPPGDTVTIPIGIATVTALGTALPEGNCELRLEMIRLKDNKWFSALGDVPLMASIVVGPAPEWAASCVSCDVPNMVGAASTYAARVRLRNDGTRTWRNGVVKLNWRLVKAAGGDLVKEAKIALAKDCKPGTIADFSWAFSAAPGGKAAKNYKLDDPAGYKLILSFGSGEKANPVEQTVLTQAIGVHESDYGVRVVDSDIPATLAPGQSIAPKVVLRNYGAQPWDGKRTKIGYHWYSEDGAEAVWDGAAVPLKTTIQPGWPVVVTGSLVAPDREGVYTLVWDLMMDGKWLSPGSLSRGGDILPVRVEVTKNPPPPADAAGAAGTDPATQDKK